MVRKQNFKSMGKFQKAEKQLFLYYDQFQGFPNGATSTTNVTFELSKVQ